MGPPIVNHAILKLVVFQIKELSADLSQVTVLTPVFWHAVDVVVEPHLMIALRVGIVLE